METIKDLLKAVIAYQDVVDEFAESDTASLYFRMLDKADAAKKQYPHLLGKYKFEYSANKQDGFDNLQEFIDDFWDKNLESYIDLDKYNEESMKI